MAIFTKNFDWEKEYTSKAKVLEVAERALEAGALPLRDTPVARWNDPATFAGRKVTLGGLHFRSVAHLHEHLGQLIAYARSAGVKPPWAQ